MPLPSNIFRGSGFLNTEWSIVEGALSKSLTLATPTARFGLPERALRSLALGQALGVARHAGVHRV